MAAIPATPGPYQPRSLDSIASGMIALFQAINTTLTDWSDSSIILAIFLSVASKMEEQSSDQLTLLQEAISQLGYSIFDFAPLPPKAATGALLLTITNTGGQAIPVGTTWTPAGSAITYQTTAPYTIPTVSPGTQVSVAAQCTVLGTIGNLPAGQAGALAAPIAGVSTVTGGTFSDGADPETPTEMRERFGQYAANLHRGPKASLEVGARTAQLLDSSGNVTEQVQLARALDLEDDSAIERGNAVVAIYNGRGTPGGMATSSGLVAQAQQVITGYVDTSGTTVPGSKAAGIAVTTQAVAEVLVTVSATITPAYGASPDFLGPAVQAALAGLFASLRIGDPLVLTQVQAVMNSVPGVADVVMTILIGGTPVAANADVGTTGLALLSAVNLTYTA
jgi:uncharacterized phage protein gp47/JayE